MKATLIIIISCALALSSCKKEEFVPKPTAAMEVRWGWGGPLNTDTSLVVGTDDVTILASTSLNAAAIEWDLGNGKKSQDPILNLSYSERGEYRVTLTAIGKDGSKSTSSKMMYVKDRTINSIAIDYARFSDFNTFQDALPVFSKLDLWVELKFDKDTWPTYTSNRDVDINSFYQSPVFQQIDSGFHNVVLYNRPHSNLQ